MTLYPAKGDLGQAGHSQEAVEARLPGIARCPYYKLAPSKVRSKDSIDPPQPQRPCTHSVHLVDQGSN